MFSSGMDVNVRKTEITTNSFKYEPGELYRDPSANRVYRFVEVSGDGNTAAIMAGSPLAFIPTSDAGRSAVRSPLSGEAATGLHFAGIACQTDWAITEAMADTAGIRYGIWAMVGSGAKQMGHASNQDNPAYVPIGSIDTGGNGNSAASGLMGFGAADAVANMAAFTGDSAVETPLLVNGRQGTQLWVTFSTGIAKQALGTTVTLTDDNDANGFIGPVLQVANGTDGLTYGLVVDGTSTSPQTVTTAVATTAATAVDKLSGGTDATIQCRSITANGYFLNGQY